MLLFLATCLSFCSGRHSATSSVEDVGLHCQLLEVDSGYGYVILYGNDTLIRQPFIPVVRKRLPFFTPEDALKIGELVREKMCNEQLPTITLDEIEKSGIRLQ